VRVEHDLAFAELALDAALARSELPRRECALATELTYGSLRLRGRLDACLDQVVERGVASLDLGLRNLLRIGSYQLLCLDSIPAHAAVHETVELARLAGYGRATKLVNAVLRNVDRKGRKGFSFPPETDPVGHVRDFGSVPEWIAARWVTQFGPAEALELALACCDAPPRTIRVSPGVDPAVIARRLRGELTRYAPAGITALGSDPLLDAGFERGDFSVQDEGSQLVTLLLGAQPGETVVDCCAAPGSKTVQLAQRVGPGGEVIALERNSRRIPLILRAARRLRLRNVRALERDAARGFDLQGRLHFGRILVDAPCSGLGALRRNPDARWRIQESDVARCAEQAFDLLRSAARYVEPGGVLVYSVCTFTPDETDQVIERFLAESPDFHVDDPRPFLPPGAKELVDNGGRLRTFPHRHRCDGFFAVRLVREEPPPLG
jgi:16S rRNA (cytosine967-C5)-methyltransferase